MEQEKPVEVVKEEKKDPFTSLKWGLILLAVLSWFVLIGLKFSSNISLKIPLTISVFLTILGLFGWFWKSIAQKMKSKEEKITAPRNLSKEEVMEILHKTVRDRLWDHIAVPNGILKCETRNKGNNLIYVFEVELLHKEPHVIIINATCPEEEPTYVRLAKIKNPTLEKLINEKSTNPKDDPDMEISEETMDSFGKPIRKTQRIIHAKKEEKGEDTVI